MDIMAMSEDKQCDLTTCSLCFETYKKPKYFQCLHSFCEGCIQTYITSAFGQTKGGVHCPVCRIFVSKPVDINTVEWAEKLPTNHILVSLINVNETKSGHKMCAECERENETESASTWCVNCSEALCKSCGRNHRRNKASSDHKLIDHVNGTEIPLHHADVFCTEHKEEKVKVFCKDHSAVCCVTCVMLKHRKCDNVELIEDAASEIKKSKETEEFSEKLENLKSSLVALCKNRTENIQKVESDIRQMRSDVEILFKEISCHLNKLKSNMMSEISKVEKEILPEIENEHFELKCRISAIENDLTLFHTNMNHASPAQFIKAMDKLTQQKELLENYMKDQSQSLRDIRLMFKENKKIHELSRFVQEFGEVKVTRRENFGLQLSENNRVKMLTSVPNITLQIITKFTVTGIDLLENGQGVLSNYDNKEIELRNSRFSSVLSGLSLPGNPSGVKMTSGKEGAVAVQRHGLVLFKIQNNQIMKVAFINSGPNLDFVFHKGKYYIGCNKRITVFDDEHRRLSDISVNNDVGYMDVRDDMSLCYTVDLGRELFCITMDGAPVFTYSHDKLHNTKGVTVGNDGNIYVCGYLSMNVHQLSHEGKLQRIIIDNLPSNPYRIRFNSQGNMAVVACWKRIVLYNLI